MPYVVQRQTIQGSNNATFTFPDTIQLLFYGIDSFNAQVDDQYCEITGLGVSLTVQNQDATSVKLSVSYTLTNADLDNCSVGVTVLAYIGSGPPSCVTIASAMGIPSGQTKDLGSPTGTPAVLVAALTAFSLAFDGDDTSEVVGMGAGIGATLDYSTPIAPALCAVGSTTLTGEYSASSNTVSGNVLALTRAAGVESGVYVGMIDSPTPGASVTVAVGAPFAQVAVFLTSFFAEFQIALIKTGAMPEFGSIGFGASNVTVNGDGTFSFLPQGTMEGNYSLEPNSFTAPSIASSYTWIAVPGTADAVGTNLIQNPGFESGQLAPWTSSGNVAVTTTWPLGPHQGQYACTLVGRSFATSEVQQTVTIAVAGVYQFVAYASLQGPAGASGASIRLSMSGNTLYVGTITSFEWAPLVTTLMLEAGTVVVSCTVFGAASAALDDVSLVLLPSTPSWTFNPGFATGSLFPWQVSGDGTAAVELVDGTNVAVLTTSRGAVAIAQTIVAPEATQYQLAATAGTTIASGVTLMVTVNSGIVWQQAVSGDAQSYTSTFNAPAGAQITISYSAPAGGGQATLGAVDLQLLPPT